MDPTDEPTFLTFAIDFNFDNITLSNSLDLDNFLWQSPLFQDATSSNPNSAQKFLNSRGYPEYADGLKTFKELLRYLTFQAPWYFQSLNGLSSMWLNSTDSANGFKAKDIKLEVGTLEAVDLRMTEIANLYRTAIYDKEYMRARVPDNLRWFTMDIYVAEFRNLRFRLPGSTQSVASLLGVNTAAIGNLLGGGNELSNVLRDYGYIKFRCRQCEFDFSQTMPTYSQIGDGPNTKMATNKFGIKIGYFEEEQRYGDGTEVYDSNLRTKIKNPWGTKNLGAGVQNAGSFLSGLPGVGKNIQDAGEKVKEGLSKIGGLINPALVAAANFLDTGSTQGVKNLGDVYSTGYASNGDTPPTPPNPPKGKLY